MFSFFGRNKDAHLERARVLLREAHMARIEHQAASEHHKALADMYTQRVDRLEREIDGGRPVAWKDVEARPVADVAPTLRPVVKATKSA